MYLMNGCGLSRRSAREDHFKAGECFDSRQREQTMIACFCRPLHQPTSRVPLLNLLRAYETKFQTWCGELKLWCNWRTDPHGRDESWHWSYTESIRQRSAQ